MKISEVIESMTALQREYGDVDVAMLYRTDGYTIETVNVPLEGVPYAVLVEL